MAVLKSLMDEGWKVGQNVLFRGSWNRRSNKHGTFWHVVTTGYFYVLFLWTISVLGFLLSTITFTVNSHADNHFYKYICFKYYTRHVLTKAFYIQIWVSFEIPLLFFLIRTMFFFCCRLCKNYWITYCTHMTSHVISVDEIAGVIISVKKIIKS